MTSSAIDLRLFRIIKAPGTVSGDAAQQEGVVMILAPQEVFVLGQLRRQTDFVASRTELRAFVQGLEKGLFVEIRFAFDELLVDELKKAIGAKSKRIMNRLVNGVVSVTPRAVDVVDRMAGGAGYARLGCGMFFQVEIRIIESAAEEWHDIVTAGAPAGSFHISVAFEANLASFTNAEQVGLVVER